LAQNFYKPELPDDKEITKSGETSNQFPWLNQPFIYGTQPLHTCAPVHNSKNDPTLLRFSLKKRLRFLAPYRFNRITSLDQVLGHVLYHSFCRAHKINPNVIEPFNEQIFAECINLNEFAQLTSKTQSVIMANASRSDPDWRYTFARIFTKTQHKINEDSLFTGWKACQTLALMHDFLILVLGPVKKYQRLFIAKNRPSHIFVYGGHTPFDLSKVAQKFFKQGSQCRINDFSAFDQSQGAESVVQASLLMLRAGIPKFFVDLFTQFKLQLTTQFGAMEVMRYTGEPGTYDENSDYSIGVTETKFIFDDKTLRAYSGDDFASSGAGILHPNWEKIEPLFKLRFKSHLTQHPLFCGYYIGQAGAIRAPRALFTKLIISEADGSLPEKIASYLTEFVVGHSLGDAFWSLLPPEQIIFQCANFDFFCRKASREQKISLKLGEVPLLMCQNMLSQGVRWLTRPLYAILNREARLRLIKRTVGMRHHFHDSPELEGILLSNLPSEQ